MVLADYGLNYEMHRDRGAAVHMALTQNVLPEVLREVDRSGLFERARRNLDAVVATYPPAPDEAAGKERWSGGLPATALPRSFGLVLTAGAGRPLMVPVTLAPASAGIEDRVQGLGSQIADGFRWRYDGQDPRASDILLVEVPAGSLAAADTLPVALAVSRAAAVLQRAIYIQLAHWSAPVKLCPCPRRPAGHEASGRIRLPDGSVTLDPHRAGMNHLASPIVIPIEARNARAPDCGARAAAEGRRRYERSQRHARHHPDDGSCA
jgi:hypothetical protein